MVLCRRLVVFGVAVLKFVVFVVLLVLLEKELLVYCVVVCFVYAGWRGGRGQALGGALA